MLNSIDNTVLVRCREVVRFWEGPLSEARLYGGGGCGNYYFLCVVIHAHYLPVSKPDVMFYVFVYNSVCMSFVTHLVWCSLYELNELN